MSIHTNMLEKLVRTSEWTEENESVRTRPSKQHLKIPTLVGYHGTLRILDIQPKQRGCSPYG